MNQKYIPQYPIFDPEDMVSRDQIRLVPETSLKPFQRAELNHLRSGKAGYRILVADSPENRQNIAVLTSYFQMVAYKEGWDFDPDRYQVKFVSPDNPELGEDGLQKRLYEFDENAEPEKVHPQFRLSPERRVGFVTTELGDYVSRMEPEETDGLARRALKFFGL